MPARDHHAATAGGPQTRWGICTCGWVSGEERRGIYARERAMDDALDHVTDARSAAALENDVGGAR